jgi:hypothetical protein
MTDPPILLQRIPVSPSGRVETKLPAGVPLFEVLRRVDGKIAVGRDGQAFHVGGFNFGQPNTTARCVGCHAGHSMMPVSEDATWTNLAPSASVSFLTGQFSSSSDLLPFKAQWLVDRSTRNEIKRRDATYDLDEPARMGLKFSGRIQARKVILRGSGDVPTVVGSLPLYWGVRVDSYLDGAAQEVLTGQTPTPEGQEFEFNSALEIDELVVTVSAMMLRNGTAVRYSGVLFPGFSEIEVIGRSVESESASDIAFLRGDSDSDAMLSLSDAVTTLGYLFEGGSAPRCIAALDFNADGGIAIDDAIFTLEYLFLGGRAPSPPFPGCGKVPGGDLLCAVQACP